jgi:predicted  nucleic acid-binding Zn-ribbon protein
MSMTGKILRARFLKNNNRKGNKMPRTTKKDITMDNNITVMKKRISTLTDRIVTLERKLSTTQDRIQEDMKRLVEMVKENSR